MSALISIPNTSGPAAGMSAPASAFLAEAQANPVYNIPPFANVAEILPYLRALASQLSADLPAMSGVKNKAAPDARTQVLLAEMIVATTPPP